MLDYPDDESTYGTDDELLFGSDLLVAPVLREGATSRGLYLPAGEWYDFWTGARVTGGKGIDMAVTLASIPIFVRIIRSGVFAIWRQCPRLVLALDSRWPRSSRCRRTTSAWFSCGMKANPALERTAHQRCWWVPSALRASAAAQRER